MEKNYQSRSGRRLALVLAMAASSVVAVAASSASNVSVASADTPITVTASKRIKQYTTDRSEWLPAFRVKNNTPFNLIVTVSFAEAPKGTQFSIGSTSGLTLGYGMSGWKNRTFISFSGKELDINYALASMKLHTSNKGKVTLKVTATADDTKFVYEPNSSHYYGFIEAKGVTWTSALDQAAALSFRDTPAYLAAITSEAENDFISYNIENAANAWIGATDKDKEGEFKWVTGESAGTTFWKAICSDATGADSCTGANTVDNVGTYKTTAIDNPTVNTYSSWDRGVGKWGQAYEPNNWRGDEDYVATNWLGTVGRWNDLKNTDTADITGFIVEFASQPGKLFNGVVQAQASYNVVPTPSIYAPSAVLVNKSGLGKVTISWSAPKVVKKPTLLMKVNKSKLKDYVVTASSRSGQELCTDKNSQSGFCVLEGFLPGEELRFTVHARYTKPPLGLGRFGNGQKVFATSDVTEPDDYVLPARLDLPNFRPVRDGTRVIVAGSGLKPGSAYTVKANGVLVASGTVGSDGAIPAGQSFLFPFSSLPTGLLEKSKVEYAMRATPVDGAERNYYVSYFFTGKYVWSAMFGMDSKGYYFENYPGVLVTHTPLAN